MIFILKWFVAKHYIFDTIRYYAGFDLSFIFLLGFIVGPFFEELAFRLPLKKNLWYFEISGFIIFFALAYIIFYSLLISFIVGSIFSLSIFLFYKKALQLRKKVGFYYDKYYNAICISSILLFTTSHLPFRIDFSEILFLIPILSGAIAITIIRLKYNFWYGFLFHILLNTCLKICWFFFPTIFEIPI
ncbi:MAG: hypothetical protein AB1777_11245 [Bacteroidota bacterium]